MKKTDIRVFGIFPATDDGEGFTLKKHWINQEWLIHAFSFVNWLAYKMIGSDEPMYWASISLKKKKL